MQWWRLYCDTSIRMTVETKITAHHFRELRVFWVFPRYERDLGCQISLNVSMQWYVCTKDINQSTGAWRDQMIHIQLSIIPGGIWVCWWMHVFVVVVVVVVLINLTTRLSASQSFVLIYTYVSGVCPQLTVVLSSAVASVQTSCPPQAYWG